MILSNHTRSYMNSQKSYRDHTKKISNPKKCMIFIFVEVVENASGIHPRVAHALIR